MFFCPHCLYCTSHYMSLVCCFPPTSHIVIIVQIQLNPKFRVIKLYAEFITGRFYFLLSSPPPFRKFPSPGRLALPAVYLLAQPRRLAYFLLSIPLSRQVGFSLLTCCLPYYHSHGWLYTTYCLSPLLKGQQREIFHL